MSSKAQNPYRHFTEAIDIRYDSKQPVINYSIEIDSTELSFINMEMKLRNVPDSFRIALFVHPEYDDRFYRFIEDLEIDKGTVRRLQTTLWAVRADTHEVTIRYKIHLPQETRPRAAWRPFLSSTGGLIGGPQCYFYVVGATGAPAYVHLKLPAGWQIATGLQPTVDPLIFFSPTAGVLFDSPILAGNLKQWNFEVDGVPHKIVYWPSDHATTFDTGKLIGSIQKLATEANKVFGRLPYKDYSFLIQDDAYGALEHANSVTLGITSEELKNQMDNYLTEIAHEYFHSWNLVRIRPSGYGEVGYTKPALSKELWWSEGLTMFYADVLLRRAGLIHSPRTEHLERLIDRYFSNAGNNKLSAEQVSRAAYAPPGLLGDYDGSTHLQGELIGTLLDIFIRDASDGKKSMDDVMRKMMERFSGSKGFTGKDIENLISEISGKTIRSFFDDHVRGNKAIDFNHYLRLIGLEARVDWKNARSEDGKDLPDTRVYAYQLPDEAPVLIGIRDPSGCWGKAGLHTGDEIISINDSLVHTPRDFYTRARSTHIGDQLQMMIKRKSRTLPIRVVISGYQIASTSIQQNPRMNAKQQQLVEQWKKAE